MKTTTLRHLLLPLLCLFTTLSAQAQRTATAVPTVINGFVVSITVTDGGAGYGSPPSVTVSGGSGSGATATATVLNGVVDKVIVKNAGSDYMGNPVVTIAAPPSPKPPFSDGLVAYYPFNGNANDESGSGKIGVGHNALFTEDRFGHSNSALLANGTNSFVNATADGLPSTDRTVAVWYFATDTFTSRGQNLLGYGGEASFLMMMNSQDIGQGKYDTQGHYGRNRLLVPIAEEMPRWHQWSVTILGAKITTYIDGIAMGSTSTFSFSTGVEGKDLIIGTVVAPTGTGAYSDQNGTYFHGKLDDVRIYNRALSDQEVKDLYHYEAPDQPWVSIEVETVRVTMHVKPTKKYQLESSSDLKSWSKVGDVILAGSSEIPLTLNVLQVGQFFRINEVQ